MFNRTRLTSVGTVKSEPHVPEKSGMQAANRHMQFAVVALTLIAASLVGYGQTIYDSSLFKTLSWRNVGPFEGGRATTGVGVPGNAQLYYMGATGGGVWKSENGGQTWRNISDGFFATGSIGDIAVYANDPNIIYVGTGEAPVRGQMSSTGDGVYKSADAGKTWTHIGLEKTLQISRVVIHPRNPSLVYVAAQGNRWAPSDDRGVYRTSDGGATWKRIVFSSETAGASDIEMDPSDPNTLYAAFWDLERFPWAIRSGGSGSGIWKTTDGGDHWERLTAGLPEMMGKIRLAISSAKTSRVYAAIECETSGLFRSDDAGKTWQQVNRQGGLASRPFYYMGVTADPKNQDIVYYSGASLLKSTDGGKTFSAITTRHSDTHSLWINPADPQNMIDTDDGGAEVSFDAGKSWSPIDNQPTGQFYAAQTDDQFPYRIYGGQQDGSAKAVLSRAFGRGDRSNWTRISADETARLAFDPKNPRVVYSSDYQGILHRTDMLTGLSQDVSAWPGQKLGTDGAEMTYRFGWSSPVAWSPFDLNLIYHAANVLFRTSDQGVTWTQISPDLTRNDKAHQGRSGLWWHDGSGGEVYNTIYSIVESPHERGTIWVGTDDGLVQLTRDGGRNWTNVTPKDWPEGWVYNIEVSPHDKATAYVALSRHRTGDPAPHFYKTADYGRTWTDLAVSLPQEYPARVIREDPKRKGLLFAATEYAVWISFDDGQHWQVFQQNLPRVPISDLTIHDDDLIAATEGRGFWIMDDITPLRQITPQSGSTDLYLFKPRNTYRILDVPAGPMLASPPGWNPPDGVMIRYLLARQLTAADKLRLEIVNTQGEVVRTYHSTVPTPSTPTSRNAGNEPMTAEPKLDDSTARQMTAQKQPSEIDGGQVRGQRTGSGGSTSSAPRLVALTSDQGLNQIVWDFRGTALLGTTGNGPLLPSGRYQIRMTLGATTVSQPFELLSDPRAHNTAPSETERLVLTRHLMQVAADTNVTVRELSDVLKQARDLEQRANSAPANVREGILFFANQLDSFAKRMQPSRTGPGDQTVLNVGAGPMGLLSTLQNAVDTGDGPVTQGERLRATEIEAECVNVRRLAKNTINAGVARVNALAQSAGLKPVITLYPKANSESTESAPGFPETAVRTGKALVRDKVIPYRVETGETIIRNPAGIPRATIFAVSYLAQDTNAASRPVTFIFNGGPGGSTWPLREAISPKMIVRTTVAPGFAFANNPDSLIDVSDLVFIDAPGTGYSRFLGEEAEAEYWGIEEDGRAFADFIANWVESHKRGASPKFVLGESYGGTRAAQILKALAARPDDPIHLRGVVLVSPAVGTGAADLMARAPSAALPTEAVVARYYGRGAYTDKTLEQVAAEAEAFAEGPYAAALRAGEKLQEDERQSIARQVSAFIGIPPDEVMKSDLVMSTSRFRDLLLADKGERIGSDARRHYPKEAAAQAEPLITTANGYDLHAAIVSLLRDELGYRATGPYVRDPGEAGRAWDNTITSEPSGLPEILKDTATADSQFGVFLGGGYFDLILPYFLSLRSLSLAGLPSSQFVHHLYPSEHAFLNDMTNRARATDDIRAFYRQTLSR